MGKAQPGDVDKHRADNQRAQCLQRSSESREPGLEVRHCKQPFAMRLRTATTGQAADHDHKTAELARYAAGGGRTPWRRPSALVALFWAERAAAGVPGAALRVRARTIGAMSVILMS